MTYDEALAGAYEGMRVRHPAFAPGVYVEHLFSRGLVKCWPVETADQEPNRSQCDFRATDEDTAATWEEWANPYPQGPVTQPPGNPKSLAEKAVKAGWGAPLDPKAAARAIVNSGSWGKPAPATAPPKPAVAPVEFCAECDFEKSACKCPKPAANKWGNTEPKKEPGKWG